MELSLPTIAALTGVAFLAGVIDAIAGGGGLLTVPALLTAGLPPHLVFGTNKGSAVFGSGRPSGGSRAPASSTGRRRAGCFRSGSWARSAARRWCW